MMDFPGHPDKYWVFAQYVMPNRKANAIPRYRFLNHKTAAKTFKLYQELFPYTHPCGLIHIRTRNWKSTNHWVPNWKKVEWNDLESVAPMFSEVPALSVFLDMHDYVRQNPYLPTVYDRETPLVRIKKVSRQSFPLLDRVEDLK